MCLVLVPVFPLEMRRRGLSETTTGAVFAAYAISLFVSPPLVTKVLFRHFHRRFLTQLGVLLLALAVLGYGAQYYLP